MQCFHVDSMEGAHRNIINTTIEEQLKSEDVYECYVDDKEESNNNNIKSSHPNTFMAFQHQLHPLSFLL